MKINKINGFVTGLALAVALNAAAAPLKRAEVAADPFWVIHLDCDGLRPTAVGKFVLAEMEKPEAKAKIAGLQAIANFDIKTQLHGLTLYGAGATPEEGVLIVYGEIDPDRLMTIAKAAKEYESAEHKTHTIHSWIDDNKKEKGGEPPRVYAAIQGQRVIFGRSEDSVAKALDVLDGGPNLATSRNFPDLGAAGKASFVQGAARKLNISAKDPNAAMLRLAKLIQLEVGESEQVVTGRLRLTGENEEVGKNIATIAQGLLAIVKLQSDNPQAQKLAAALTVTPEGATTQCVLKLPAADAIGMIKADEAKKAEHKRKAE